jgi:hypothetical protein
MEFVCFILCDVSLIVCVALCAVVRLNVVCDMCICVFVLL